MPPPPVCIYASNHDWETVAVILVAILSLNHQTSYIFKSAGRHEQGQVAQQVPNVHLCPLDYYNESVIQCFSMYIL